MSRPWSELTYLSENEKFFFLGAKAGPIVVPKSAFASEAARTELRALVSGHLKRDQSIVARGVEFTCGRDDYRRARSLHNKKAGGWRLLVKQVAILVCMGIGIVAVVRSMASPRNPAVIGGLVAAIVAGPVLRITRARRKRYFGRLEIRFNDQGLLLRDSRSEARQKWTDYIGYLSDSYVLLLYVNPRTYRIIPQRALLANGQEFKAMVEKKLPRFDYRNPAPLQAAGVSAT